MSTSAVMSLPLTVAEYVIWCDRNSGVIHHMSWPTYIDHRVFTRAAVNTFSELVMHITPLGYRLKTVTTRRAGFLWLCQEKTYIFERIIPLGSPVQMLGGTVTGRVVPNIEDQLEGWLQYNGEHEDGWPS